MGKIFFCGKYLSGVIAGAIVIGLATSGSAMAQGDPPIIAPEVLPLDEGGQNAGGAISFALSTGCFRSRTNGSGITAFNWCFSENGNLNMLEHSAGLEHIAIGTVTEGFCLAAGFTQRARVDGGAGMVGLEEPTYPSNTKVQHKTLDGDFRIEQRFVQSAGGKEVIIIMKVVNISSSPINDVFLTRYVDPDMSNSTSDDVFVAASRSVAVMEPGSARLELIPKTESFNANSMVFNTFLSGSELDGDCYNAAADNLDEYTGDGSMAVQYQLGNIFPGSSKTVRFVYHVSI